MDRVGLFGLVQGTCLFVLNIYENVNVNSFMQSINVKVLYLNNKHNFQITLARKKLLGQLEPLVCTAFENHLLKFRPGFTICPLSRT